MKKLKKLCSMVLCLVMTTAFTITPTYALEGNPTATATITGGTELKGSYAGFTADQEVKSTLSQTTAALGVTLEASIEYNNGTTTKTITAAAVNATTSTSTTTDVTFTFKKDSLNTLPVGTYEIKAGSTTTSANAVTKQKVGTISITNGTPVVTIDKQISLTKTRGNFLPADGAVNVKLDKAFFAAVNPVALELTASIANGTTTTTAKASATANGNVTFTFTQADLNKLPEGTFSVVITSAGNTINSAIKETKVGEITITPMRNATVVTPQTFDLAKQTDVVIGIENNGHNLLAIKNGTTTLVKGTDYIVSNNYITINKSYLSKFTTGTQFLTFDYDGGSDPICAITITKTTKLINVILNGYNNKTAKILYNKATGSTLPGWSKSKYKAAGRKGYQFIGWSYNGKAVTTVPESDTNVTLTAMFTKLTVGKAVALTVTGKSGKGVGFVATSKASTKDDGSRRGFRFRYSLKSNMSSATYKTTGLAKNVYTKTGLSKGKKYYVQVRYYYYDSTNSKVYGAYSKSKTVKAY